MALLTVAQFREHVTTALVDAAVQRLLDAAELAILSHAGALGSQVDRRRGGGTLITLARPAASIASVKVWYGDVIGVADVTLDSTDYALLADGFTLRREWTGTHPSTIWEWSVEVASTALDDTAERKRVQLELVRLDVNYNPGLTSEQIGDWLEQYSSSVPYAQERLDILASLAPTLAWFA